MWFSDDPPTTHGRADHQAGADQGFIGIERHQPDHDVGQFGRIGREVGPQRRHVRQLPSLKSGGKFVGQFALAAALVRELGGDQAQGYPIARPLTPIDAARWLRA